MNKHIFKFKWWSLNELYNWNVQYEAKLRKEIDEIQKERTKLSIQLDNLRKGK